MDQEEYQTQQLAAARNQAQLDQEQQAAEEQAQKEEQEKNKMGWGVFIPSLIISIIGDLIEIFTVGTIGWFTGLLIDFILFMILGPTRAAQKQYKKLLVALFAESIPIVGALPLRTIILIWAFVASRPKLMQKINKSLKIASMVPSPIAAELKLASKAVNIATASEQGDIKGAALGAASLRKTINKPPVIPPPRSGELTKPPIMPPSYINQSATPPMQIASDTETDAMRNRWASKNPDWMTDQKVNEGMKAREQRMEVARGLGKSEEEAFKMALEGERGDDERRRQALQLN